MYWRLAQRKKFKRKCKIHLFEGLKDVMKTIRCIILFGVVMEIIAD